MFLLWAAQGAPHLAKTSLLRRRLKRLVARAEGLSRVLKLGGVVERIEYWTVGSQLEGMLVHLELAQQHFPEDWQKVTRLKAPAFVRLVTDNPFPRSMVTTRLGRGLFTGPFASRAAAERYETGVLDLFQIRRWRRESRAHARASGLHLRRNEQVLAPPAKPQSLATSICTSPNVWSSSSAPVAHPSLNLPPPPAITPAPTCSLKRRSACTSGWSGFARPRRRAGDLARPLDQLAGVAVVRAAAGAAVDFLFFLGGRWLEPRRLILADTVDGGQSLDRRVRELIADVASSGPLTSSTWRSSLAGMAQVGGMESGSDSIRLRRSRIASWSMRSVASRRKSSHELAWTYCAGKK